MFWKRHSCCSFTYPTAAVVSNSLLLQIQAQSWDVQILFGTLEWKAPWNGLHATRVVSLLRCHCLTQDFHIKCTVQLFNSLELSSCPRVVFEVLNAAISPLCYFWTLTHLPTPGEPRTGSLLCWRVLLLMSFFNSSSCHCWVDKKRSNWD